ncbi:twin-arginine translocase subunit TatB [Pseudooceanicola sp. HF7]|nr:twin-arginine translocase subunit TatB [Pseudooceanicola sp. HF7]
MFGMGWTEILVVGVVALIVVGPKELPGLFRNVGQFVGRARGMAREFTRAMEDAADQSGMREASNTLKGLSNPKSFGLDKLKEATDVTKWTPDSNTGKLSAERAEASKKIQEAAASAATRRMEAEASASSGVAKAPVTPTIHSPSSSAAASKAASTSHGSGSRAAAQPPAAQQVQPATPRPLNRPVKKRGVQRGATPRSRGTRNAPVRKD